MTERPRPDIDHTREALREHDERVEEEEREAAETGPDEDEDEDED